MTRYDPAHKQATRHRIFETAGRLFKQHGIDGIGIATLMAEAGLTNGAFYAHFRSKDELVAAVIAEELRAQADAFTCLAPGAEGMAALVRSYLSARHRDDRAAGCPSAALLGEIGRRGDSTRDAYTRGARALITEIAARVPPADAAAAHGRALAVLALMTGSLQLARAVTDPRLSQDILDEGIANALTLAGVDTTTRPTFRP